MNLIIFYVFVFISFFKKLFDFRLIIYFLKSKRLINEFRKKIIRVYKLNIYFLYNII